MLAFGQVQENDIQVTLDPCPLYNHNMWDCVVGTFIRVCLNDSNNIDFSFLFWLDLNYLLDSIDIYIQNEKWVCIFCHDIEISWLRVSIGDSHIFQQLSIYWESIDISTHRICLILLKERLIPSQDPHETKDGIILAYSWVID